MKIITIIALVLLTLLVGCLNKGEDTFFSANYDIENLKLAELSLPEMFCGSCASSAKKALNSIDGVVHTKIDYKLKTGMVVYDFKKTNTEIFLKNGFIKAYDGTVNTDRKYNTTDDELFSGE